MAQFNHDAPYGEISPITNGAVYWQAPNMFDSRFNHINEKGEVLEWAQGTKAPPLRTKEAKKERQQKEIAARQSNPNTAAKTVEPQGNVSSGLLDLKAWANGEAKGVQWFAIKKQMQDEGFDPVPQTAIAAREAIMARASEDA